MSAAAMVAAIRADSIVGSGSCSFIDECYTDAELAARLAEEGIGSVRNALAWARRAHRIWAEVQADRSNPNNWS